MPHLLHFTYSFRLVKFRWLTISMPRTDISAHCAEIFTSTVALTTVATVVLKLMQFCKYNALLKHFVIINTVKAYILC